MCYCVSLFCSHFSSVDGTEQETELAANCLWLVTNSKPCPNCKSPIQKNEGCNHMKCSKVRASNLRTFPFRKRTKAEAVFFISIHCAFKKIIIIHVGTNAVFVSKKCHIFFYCTSLQDNLFEEPMNLIEI